MILRKLRTDDAEHMYEWMHDDGVVHFMMKDFNSMTMADCQAFIKRSEKDNINCNMAIADDTGKYMGTVSLKNINRDTGSAEFAIVLCREAIGKGYGSFGMREMIKKGFSELGLKKIYWSSNAEDPRAQKFYHKMGYSEMSDYQKEELGLSYEGKLKLIWYMAVA